MGLDMYLHKKTFVRNWDHMEESEKNHVSIKGAESNHIVGARVSEITEQIAYWRKANHIHNWFVENVQNGEDDCGEYYVTEEHVKSLNEACKKVLDDNSLAEELLPTASGFFFGGVEYDKYYFESVLDTWNITSALIQEMKSWNSVRTDLSYQASW